MKSLTFLALAGFLSVGMAVNGHCFQAGADIKSDCIKAEAIILVSYDPNRAEHLVFEYLYGKDTSAAQLASMEIKEETRFPKKCELIVFARYIKGDILGGASVCDQVFGYSIQGEQVMEPNGQNVSLGEVKQWIKEKESTKPPISL